MNDPSRRPKVGLFVTCLVDLIRPTIGFAAAKLIEDSGCDVEVPPTQTCCGQPAYNSGDRGIRALSPGRSSPRSSRYDYVVAPSGSCGGMLKHHYAELFADDPDLARPRRGLRRKGV